VQTHINITADDNKLTVQKQYNQIKYMNAGNWAEM